MPGKVGAGSFWKGMVACHRGQQDVDTTLKQIDEQLAHHVRTRSAQLTRASRAGACAPPVAREERMSDQGDQRAARHHQRRRWARSLLYYVLNKLAERLPGKWEDRIKPYFFILPAVVVIGFFLIYPAVRTLILSFANADSHGVGRAEELHRPAEVQ